MENVKKMINSLCSKISYIFSFLKKRVHIKINTDYVLEHIIVLELYTLLTILAFHKLLILGIDRVLIGDGGDAYQHIWNFWWVKKAILEGRNVFYTDYLFYPHGTHLYFHTLNLFWSFISLPLQFFLDRIIIYNLFIMIACVLNMFFFYFLIYTLLQNKRVSFLGGVSFGFSTYFWGKALGQLDLASIFIFPLFLIFYIHFMKSKNFIQKIYYAFLISLSFLLSFLIHYHYFLVLLLVAIFLVLVDSIIIRDIGLIKGFLLVFLFSLLLLSPFVIIYLRIDYRDAKIPIEDAASTKIEDYFKPSPFSIIGEFTNHIFYPWPEYRSLAGATSIGYTQLLIVLLAIILHIKRVIKLTNFFVKILFISFIFFILSLGPFLINLGHGSIKITSPVYNLFYEFFPFFNTIGKSQKINIGLVLFINILFCYSFYKIHEKLNDKGKNFYFILIFSSILIENFPYKYYFWEIPPLPSIEWKNSTVFEIPPLSNYRGMFYQTIHENRLIGGYISRYPSEALVSLKQIKDYIEKNDSYSLYRTFEALNTKYIILYHDYVIFDRKWLKTLELINTSRVYTSNYNSIYEIV